MDLVPGPGFTASHQQFTYHRVLVSDPTWLNLLLIIAQYFLFHHMCLLQAAGSSVQLLWCFLLGMVYNNSTLDSRGYVYQLCLVRPVVQRTRHTAHNRNSTCLNQRAEQMRTLRHQRPDIQLSFKISSEPRHMWEGSLLALG